MTESLLFGVPTWGSAIAELAFEYSKLPCWTLKPKILGF